MQKIDAKSEKNNKNNNNNNNMTRGPYRVY